MCLMRLLCLDLCFTIKILRVSLETRRRRNDVVGRYMYRTFTPMRPETAYGRVRLPRRGLVYENRFRARTRFRGAHGTSEIEEVKKRGGVPAHRWFVHCYKFIYGASKFAMVNARPWSECAARNRTISHVVRVFNAKDPSTFEEGSLGATDVVTTNHIILRSKNAQAHGAVPPVDSSTNGYRTGFSPPGGFL